LRAALTPSASNRKLGRSSCVDPPEKPTIRRNMGCRIATVGTILVFGIIGIPHAFYRLLLAHVSPGRGLLHLGGGGTAAPAGADLPADRLRAELPLSAAGLLPRPRRQRGTDPAAGPARQPPQPHLYQPARPRIARPAPRRPSRLHLGRR